MPDLPELDKWLGNFTTTLRLPLIMTYSSWLNCALRGDEAVYWVSVGQQWLVLGSTESL